MDSRIKTHGHNYPLRPATKIQLRLAGVLGENGFTVERRPDIGNEYLVVGYGQGALVKKLDVCIKKLQNKLAWANHPEGIKAIGRVVQAYGEFLE